MAGWSAWWEWRQSSRRNSRSSASANGPPITNERLPCLENSAFLFRRHERFVLEDLSALLDNIQTVHIEVLESVDHAGWPADLDHIHFLGFIQPKVNTQIARREVPVARPH